MNYEFQRVAIVNRGEAAMRFIHAAREFNQESGTALRTIAFFTEPERHAMFVREADEAFCLGPARILDSTTQQMKCSYVDYGLLERALAATRAEAVWVGWGFVAEQATFGDLCRDLGIVFIGPNGDVMRRVGDKIASKLLAEKANVRVVPWSEGPVETLDNARQRANRLGYPLLIKATAGGGVQGIRRSYSFSGTTRSWRSPCRSSGYRRSLRHYLGGRRARLHDSAPASEGSRGGSLSRSYSARRRSPAGLGRAPLPGGRIPECRHRGIPL